MKLSNESYRMNPYNFIYCYFYFFWNKRHKDGHFDAVLHVFATFAIHFFLFTGFIMDFLGIKTFSFTNFGTSGHNKLFLAIIFLPIIFAFFYFYKKENCEKIIKDYKKRKYSSKEKTTRVLIYLIVPIVMIILFALVRQEII